MRGANTPNNLETHIQRACDLISVVLRTPAQSRAILKPFALALVCATNKETVCQYAKLRIYRTLLA